MYRENMEKKVRNILLVIYVTVLAAELILLAIAAPEKIELLTVPQGFYEATLILLLVNLPIFMFAAIIASAIKEAVIRRNSYKPDKARLRLSFTSAALAMLTLMLFVTTNSTKSVMVNNVLYILTLVMALASTVVFIIYVIKNKKKG